MKKALSRKNVWEKTPARLKSILGRGLGLVPLAWLLGEDFRKSYHFVQEAQWWSAARIREYQLEQLQRICRLVYSETAYYRRTFDAVGFHPGDLKTLEDFAHLPTTDRYAIQTQADEMCTRAIERRHTVDICTTGGSSGAPITFYLDGGRSPVEYAYLVTSWERAGYTVGTPMGVFRGHLVQPSRKGFPYEYDPIFRHHYYSSYHMTDANMRRYLEHVATLGPCFLHVYPSTAANLSRFLRRSGNTPPANILGIIAESENVYTEQRAFIEDTFHARMFASYGHSEKLVLAAECEKSTDYHVWPIYGYFELLDEQGQRVTTPGECGEIVGTGFMSAVMPFVRYRTGDYATYVSTHCEACGREHVLVRDIRGHRTHEVLVAADGRALPWTGLSVDGNVETFAPVRQMQFYQERPGHAVLKIVPAEGFDRRCEQRIREYFIWKLAGALEFAIERVEAIALSPRGKTIYVDQRIELPSGGAYSEPGVPFSASPGSLDGGPSTTGEATGPANEGRRT